MDYSNYKNKLSGIVIRIVETGETFETRTACAKYLGVSVGMISTVLTGRSKTCKGYHLELVELDTIHNITDDILEELYELTDEECEWREHPWRSNLYISDTGLVAKNVRGRIIIKQQNEINSGYLVVSVGDFRTKHSLNSNVLVHRLVAETYLPQYDDEKCFVNHIDGDKHNNAAWNLEWCTRSENMRHAVDKGLAKMEPVMIVETGEIFKSFTDCAAAIGGTISGIHDCKSGRQKQHRGYHFKFFGEED